MSRQNDEPTFRTLFSEQARGDRRHVPSLEETLHRPHEQPRVAIGRLAAVAATFLLAGIIVTAAVHNARQQQMAKQDPLPNMLEAFDLTDQWQSPTACLLDMSVAVSAESAPAPDSRGPDSRQSNG
jgi:hypothetical protein